LLDINACFWIVQIDTVEASSTSTLSNLFNLVRSYYLTRNSMTNGHNNQSYFNLVKTNIVLEDSKSPSQLPYHSFELLKDFNKVLFLSFILLGRSLLIQRLRLPSFFSQLQHRPLTESPLLQIYQCERTHPLRCLQLPRIPKRE
jgi:hypothetical protein